MKTEHMPAKRPHCAGCGCPIAYWSTSEREPRWSGDWPGKIARRVFARWRGYCWIPDKDHQPDGRPLFHSLRCAAEFARAAYNAGYRLRGKP